MPRSQLPLTEALFADGPILLELPSSINDQNFPFHNIMSELLLLSYAKATVNMIAVIWCITKTEQVRNFIRKSEEHDSALAEFTEAVQNLRENKEKPKKKQRRDRSSADEKWQAEVMNNPGVPPEQKTALNKLRATMLRTAECREDSRKQYVPIFQKPLCTVHTISRGQQSLPFLTPYSKDAMIPSAYSCTQDLS